MPATERPTAIHISTSELSALGVVWSLREAGIDAVHASGSEAGLAMVEQLRPALILIGTLHPEPPHRSFTLCREIVGRWPESRIVLIQTDADDELVQADAAIVGAESCLPSTASADELAATCRDIVRGVHMSARELYISAFGLYGLTPRQRDVLRLAAEGKTAAEIASELDIKLATVRAHERAIREKFNVSSIPAAVERARRLGIV